MSLYLPIAVHAWLPWLKKARKKQSKLFPASDRSMDDGELGRPARGNRTLSARLAGADPTDHPR